LIDEVLSLVNQDVCVVRFHAPLSLECGNHRWVVRILLYL
jgi:hypothetical protein